VVQFPDLCVGKDKNSQFEGGSEPACAEASEDRPSELGDDPLRFEFYPNFGFETSLVIPHCPLQRGTLYKKFKFEETIWIIN
jgi:hypothetical protein